MVGKVRHHAFSNALKNMLEILKIFKYQSELQAEVPADH